MIVSINQPAYLPWLGYFDRIYKSDIHINLDNVQFEKNSVTNRNKIAINQGGWAWITIPLRTKGRFGNLIIRELEIDNTQKWRKKHYASLIGNYGKSNYLPEHNNWLNDIYESNWEFLGPLLDFTIDYLMKALGITTPIYKASEMTAQGKKSDYILNLCREIEATTYLSGPFGREYLDLEKFEHAGIKVRFHDYEHPKYYQLHGEFQPYMSVIDLIFNEGLNSLNVLTGGLSE